MKTFKEIYNFVSHPKDNYPNSYFLRYHVYKAFHKLFKKMGLANYNSENANDMFNWSLYHLHYQGEIKQLKKHYTLTLKNNDYIFKNNKLEKNNSAIKPLQEVYQVLYETILQLKPQSIMEMGCGDGRHLYNSQVLLPDAKLYGFDLSDRQLKYLKKTVPELNAEIKQFDAIQEWPKDLFPKVDLSYTVAVIMHIRTEEMHKIALANLFNNTNKYVLLVERWKNHNFFADIKELQSKKIINWENIYFYHRDGLTSNIPRIMICSKTPLDYTILSDYDVMPKD